MLRTLAIALLLCACTDMGPRDRSLLLGAETFPLHQEVFREKRPTRPVAQPSVIGLASDPLAPLYAEDASLVIRFADVSTLEREWKAHVGALRRLLPELGLPELPPATLLRVRFGLPDSVLVDRMRPFAFVFTDAGWAALIPVSGELEKSDRMRMLDAHYCVAGGLDAVEKYEPGFRGRFHLPGDVSVIARGDARTRLGAALGEAAAIAGMTLPALPEIGAAAAGEVQRVDLALRFFGAKARLDVRFAPDRGARGGLSDYLSALRPRRGTALQWLPERATVELTTGSDVAAWLDLARLLGGARDRLPLLRDAVATLGDDAALQVHARGDRPGVAMLVAELAAPDRKAARSYLGSESMLELLRRLARGGGHLEYTPDVFVRNDVSVGTVTGYFGASTIEEMRAQGGLSGTIAEVMRAPVVVYVALAGSRLCVVAGERSRDDMEALIDCIAGGTPRRPDAGQPKSPLLHERLFAARIDGAAVLRSLREDARHWHERGERLHDVPFEEELAVELAASVEGGALRFAVQVPDARLAAVIARIRDALREGG